MADLDRANQLGQCTCPICKAPGADVCQGKRFAYLVCESCGSLTQTRTRRGHHALVGLLGPTSAVADPAPTPTPAPAPAAPKPARKSAGLGDVAALFMGS